MVLTLVLEILKLNISFFSFFFLVLFLFSFLSLLIFFNPVHGVGNLGVLRRISGIFRLGSCGRFHMPSSPTLITPPPLFGYRLFRPPRPKKKDPWGGYQVTNSPHRTDSSLCKCLYLKYSRNDLTKLGELWGINPKSGTRPRLCPYHEAEDPTLSK